jgi:hypothetical protein
MKNFWKYAGIFFAGAFVTLTMVFFTQKPQTVINAETYIAEQNQKIGKIKQKGKGNELDVELKQKRNKSVLSFLKRNKDI